jgi:hypothetical protein
VQCCGSDDPFGEESSDSLNSIDGVEVNDALDFRSGTDTRLMDPIEKSIASCEPQRRWTQRTGSGLPPRVQASLLPSPELNSAQTFITLGWEQRTARPPICPRVARATVVVHLACPWVRFNEEMKFGISTFVANKGIALGALARAIQEHGFESLFVAEHTTAFASSSARLASSRSASLDGPLRPGSEYGRSRLASDSQGLPQPRIRRLFRGRPKRG